MENDMASVFMHTLQQVEQSRNVEDLVKLFSPDAVLHKPALLEARKGLDGAGEFWQTYLDAFRQVHSTFTQVHRCARTVVLEWVSKGTLPDGQPIDYEGVSILEAVDGKVRAFRTYYDSAAFVRTTNPGH